MNVSSSLPLRNSKRNGSRKIYRYNHRGQFLYADTADNGDSNDDNTGTRSTLITNATTVETSLEEDNEEEIIAVKRKGKK